MAYSTSSVVFNLTAVSIEGGLFAPDFLHKVAQCQATAQAPADYQLPRGLTLRDEIGRYWKIAQEFWRDFARKKAAPSPGQKTHHVVNLTVKTWLHPLCTHVLGLAVTPVGTMTHDDRIFPLGWSAQEARLPLVFAPYTHPLDKADARYGDQKGRRRSPFLLAQEYLNQTDQADWALVSNGDKLRLVHTNPSLTRAAYIEIDLEMIFEEGLYADFSVFWLLLHGSRFGLPSQALADCPLSRWHQASEQEGLRARDRLREGVTEALRFFGTGFLRHPANDALRQAIETGTLSLHTYFEQLLRLMYRLIFLATIEDRNVIFTPEAAPACQTRYWAGYSLTQLRERALQRANHDHYHDLWHSLVITFRGLSQGEPALGLPALGGLFASSHCPDLETAELENQILLQALFALCFFREGQALSRVNYKDMDSEELGSVYESLLELVPQLTTGGLYTFGFVGDHVDDMNKGHARKLTGSYYTPDSLVQALLESALDPIIEQALCENNPEQALLALTVCDPACGSGHFLLAAARRIATALAQVRTPDSTPTDQAYRHALRDVIAHCVYGVDKNPMAIELARTALWLEAYTPERPLTFLDHHLKCGDALLGWLDLATLSQPIDKAAYKALSGDDKALCKTLSKQNQLGCKELKKNLHSDQGYLLETASTGEQFWQIEAMPSNTPAEIAAKAAAYLRFLAEDAQRQIRYLADLHVGAYLLPKTAANQDHIPTTIEIYHFLMGDNLTNSTPAIQAMLAAVQQACQQAQVFHWPLAFPHIFAQGGFDCVLGNPPWERIKLQEEEFFASRSNDIAQAKNKAERTRLIALLAQGQLAHTMLHLEGDPSPCHMEQALYTSFIEAKRTAEAASIFMHDSGRYPLTGVGDVNTYALFAETILKLVSPKGRAGFIVPTGIATDDSTKAYFAHLTQKELLISLCDFENREKLFPDVDSRMKFCLLTIGHSSIAQFSFFSTNTTQLTDSRRHFTLTADEFRLINPNTLTCPIFRAAYDANLTKKIYQTAPVLIAENEPEGNPWGIGFMAMFHMSADSHLFHDQPAPDLVPLYEAKMIHQFDHRWATYDAQGNTEDVEIEEKQDPHFQVRPRYWLAQHEVATRLAQKGWTRGWLMGWRGITNVTNERSVIASIMQNIGVGNNIHLIIFGQHINSSLISIFLANISSFVFDFVARQKIGGINFNFYIPKQLPILPPDRYTEADLAFIVPRVLELTYTAYDLAAWAADLGYTGAPFPFDPERRAHLRAELDAYYARLYGLTREELCYVLDPSLVMGEDYPSETFRVLKKNELKTFGEYRTARLVLAAWDALAQGRR